MRKVHMFLTFTLILINTSCATMDGSLKLGSGIGAATGAAATYSAHRSTGQTPSFEDIALGAGVGFGVGLLASYFTHKEVEKEQDSLQSNQIEMHFGDLPPSPFVIPKNRGKRGRR